MKYVYQPKGVCSRKILLDLDGDIVRSVEFEGGCSGNTSGISMLAEGMQADELIAKLKGIKCGFKNTSCPDQLAMAVEEALKQQ